MKVSLFLIIKVLMLKLIDPTIYFESNQFDPIINPNRSNRLYPNTPIRIKNRIGVSITVNLIRLLSFG